MKKFLLTSMPACVYLMLTAWQPAQCQRAPANKLYSSCSTCDNSTTVTGLNPAIFLKGIARYRDLQWNAANKTIHGMAGVKEDFEDARSCWYSIDTLKKFICLLESEAAKTGVKHAQLGIRFYYATYDSAELAPSYKIPNQLYPNAWRFVDTVAYHHTLFMVPTFNQTDTSMPVDFDPVLTTQMVVRSGHAGEAGRTNITHKLVTMAEAATNPLYQHATLFVLGLPSALPGGNSATPSSKNQGMLCPPTCPTGTQTATSIADALYPAGTKF